MCARNMYIVQAVAKQFTIVQVQNLTGKTNKNSARNKTAVVYHTVRRLAAGLRTITSFSL